MQTEKLSRARRAAFADPSVKRGWKDERYAASHLKWLLQMRLNDLEMENRFPQPYRVHPLYQGSFLSINRRAPYDCALEA